MTGIRLTASLLAALGLGAATIIRANEASPIAIVGATLIDGNGGPPVPNTTIVTVGDRITAVGPQGTVRVPAGATVLPGQGRYVTPGLIDSNTHLSLYVYYETLLKYSERNFDLTLEAAQLNLKHGVTTVRDSYGALLPLMQVRDAIARGEAVGPRILAAGNIVGWGGPFSLTWGAKMPTALGTLWADTPLTDFQEQFNDFITQGTGEDLVEMTPAELRVAINKYLDKGPDFLKYGGTTHFAYPALMLFSPDVQKAIVEEVHKRGLVAETHATTLESLKIAILAGVDLVQHPNYIVPRRITEELVGLLRERRVLCGIGFRAVGTAWEAHIERQAAARARLAASPPRVATAASRFRERRELELDTDDLRFNAEALIRGGCTVALASDAYVPGAPEFLRSPPSPNSGPGLGTLASLEALVGLGMTPGQAIVAATKNGALACKGLDRFGTIEVGKAADILVLSADPLADIANIRKLETVIRRGRIVDRDALPVRPVFYPRSPS